MRRAQALLDEAQAERSRTLAAFAVTVGDDGSIADLMGLNEREVRLARRTVGRNDARSLAQELLSRKQRAPKEVPGETAPAPAPAPGPAAGPVPAPGPVPGSVPAPAPAPEIPLPHPRKEMTVRTTGSARMSTPPVIVPPVPATPPTVPPPPSSPPPAPPVEANSTVVWSPSMDSVLLWSWESGLDVQTVAAELGLDVRSLLMRVQELANDGMLTLANPVPEVNRSGRHRRQNFDEQAYAALFAPTTTFPTHLPY
ncbi:hypothetical protein AB0E67_08635 [Streptomyces sp. NPDC032161]|uniref:hypothetical protein n=1 Tax=unclassified Streptomyces TaxID=2593676 RepID=UPI0033CA7F1F